MHQTFFFMVGLFFVSPQQMERIKKGNVYQTRDDQLQIYLLHTYGSSQLAKKKEQVAAFFISYGFIKIRHTVGRNQNLNCRWSELFEGALNNSIFFGKNEPQGAFLNRRFYFFFPSALSVMLKRNKCIPHQFPFCIGQILPLRKMSQKSGVCSFVMDVYFGWVLSGNLKMRV